MLAILLALPASPLAAQTPTLVDTATTARLTQLVGRNPTLEARAAALRVAEARAAAAGLAPAATLDAEVEEVPSGLNLLDAGSLRVGVSRELLPSGARRARRDVALQEVERARLERDLAARSLVARAAARLVESAAAGAVARRLAAEDSLLVAAEAALTARFSVGDARYVDVLRLRSERLRVQSDRARAVAEARVARRALLALAHQAAAGEVDALIASESAATTRTLPPSPDIDSLAASSGAVQLARAEVARAQAARRLARAARRPSVVASLGLQRFEGETGHLIGPTVGASVSLPFTARGATRAATLVADREVAAAEATERAILARVHTEVATAADRYEAARAQLALYDAALLRAARDEREGALASYRAGDLTLVELLDFERSLARAEIDRLRSRTDAADALADLVASVAGIDEDEPDRPAARREGDDR
ncbi:MAG TPA: TolC family protein [Gemmatimonadaceae bacterium]|nr:TolC family protein [Gemmatimonadaceae bacterium]